MLKGEILDILFRRIAPEQLLRRIIYGKPRRINGNPFHPTVEDYQNWFMDVAETVLHGYSGDEKELLFRQAVHQAVDAYHHLEDVCQPLFSLLAHYGDEVLEYRENAVKCKFSMALDWRAVYLNLGQDLIVTAWLAHRAVNEPIRNPEWTPRFFSWPSVISTNNRNIECILKDGDGISENHCHLYGAAAVFPLNWSRLMTYPRLDEENLPWFEHRLQGRLGRGRNQNQISLKKSLLCAALLRVCLFQTLRGECVDCRQELRNFLLQTDDEGDGPGKTCLLERIDALRFRAVHLEQPDGSGSYCLDYAFTPELAEEQKYDFRISAPERALLFQAFKACFSGTWNMKTQWCFYLYLLLKADFRQEVVQMNQEIGFRNFQDYERRKFALWTVPEVGDAYWNEAYRTAVVAPLREQRIHALELRLTPKDTADDIFQLIYEIDRATAFGLDNCGNGWDGRKVFPKLDRIDECFHNSDAVSHLKSFFVFHFIKKKDEQNEGKIPIFECRHKNLRDDCRTKALAIVEALSRHPYLRHRIRGVDACSNEIGCRPEVFASSFRFLRACPTWLFPSAFSKSSADTCLSVTYHAGEDFLDIADGLRAIDEAILFLGMRRGDRIGHALALGVAPDIHYRAKHDCIVLSKQNLLDNLAWLYFRSEELNLSAPPTLKEWAHNLAEDLFTELYRKYLRSSVTLRDYYRSWKLRGDEPCLYETDGDRGSVGKPMRFDPLSAFYKTNSPYQSGKPIEDELENCRNYNPAAVEIYFLYQFNQDVKKIGRQPVNFPVSADYVAFMGQMQRRMQRYVESIGLCVECNPSSNLLIGTFDTYQQHPIFLFHKVGTYEQDSVQMHVSLNTDDQGIFDTSLSFEYAIVAAALATDVDKNGKRLYANREIEHFLRNLKRMGNEQSFANSHF